MDQTLWTYRSETEGNSVRFTRRTSEGAVKGLPSHFKFVSAVIQDPGGHGRISPIRTIAAVNPVLITSSPTRSTPVDPFGAGSPIAPFTTQRIPLPGVGGAVGAAVGALGGVSAVTDLVCRYFPSLCNVATPGARFPTEDPRTPAPGLPGARQFFQATGPCPAGHHLNKGTYWTQAGVVYPGTRCVKNRRMNPLNPRALRRAIRREGSFECFAKALGMRSSTTGRLKPKRRRSC